MAMIAKKEPNIIPKMVAHLHSPEAPPERHRYLNDLSWVLCPSLTMKLMVKGKRKMRAAQLQLNRDDTQLPIKQLLGTEAEALFSYKSMIWH